MNAATNRRDFLKKSFEFSLKIGAASTAVYVVGSAMNIADGSHFAYGYKGTCQYNLPCTPGVIEHQCMTGCVNSVGAGACDAYGGSSGSAKACCSPGPGWNCDI